ncbi:hypothetical protein RND81_14G187000 [Saponaria officinalis]|uniref:NB-ARC domain-containing protein n=1 Tax=Saponaria officinalis TaxID=3572 RepID=A0AAW1GPQ7_SAPOF
MGGLGKTALAQLVYNDDKIKDAFEVRLWVCVSNEFGMEQIFAKMIGQNVGIGIEELQREVRKMIEGRKYLLVLDDVWDENHNKWVELRDFLILGGNGSRVLTTSRSKAVARAIDNNHMYILHGLSDENSWRLFERMAFEQGKAPLDHDLVDIGKDVVKKCANVPLSIRVVGSLLYGQHKSKWLSFRSNDLRKLGSNKDGQAEDGIMPILKYSYYHLSPSLKSCFSYCALFSKDFVIRKKELIWLWMAHGCLDLVDDGQSIEDAGDDYFLILVNRCFIQDIKEGSYGEIYSCKMHDLIHDLALEVAGKETLGLETSVLQFNQKIRHLSISNYGGKLLSSDGRCLGELKKLRSLHYNSHRFSKLAANESNLNIICSNLMRLRVLDLAFFGLKSLPNTIGDLSHLRYLDLSFNYRLEILPESITKLQNLVVLNLSFCELRELPKGLRNLHNLRHLDLTHCSTLTHLADALEVDGLLNNKVHLNELVIRWETDASHEHSQGAIHETLLEGLRPHGNIKGIEIWGYEGVVSSWVGSLAVFFPCLVTVSLHYFDCLYNLASLSQLLHLKVLELRFMPNIEYIDCDGEDESFDSMSTASDRLSFFPSLEELVLDNLPKLKGVRNGVLSRAEAHRKLAVVQSFPRLHNLEIKDCPCVTVVPRCPGLKTLTLIKVNETIRFESINDNSPSDSTFYLDKVEIDEVGPINLLFGESLKRIDSLAIQWFRQEMFSAAANLFQRHASSI